MGNLATLATPEETKQKLVDKITSDLGLVLDDDLELREAVYLAFTLGERGDGLAYHNAVNESIDIFIEKHG